MVSGSPELRGQRPDVPRQPGPGLTTRQAHWIARDLILWPGTGPSEGRYALHFAPDGGLDLTSPGLRGETLPLVPDATGFPPHHERFPHLGGATALRIPPSWGNRVAELLKGQLAVAIHGPGGEIPRATGLQTAGALDDLFATEVPLGLAWEKGRPILRVWAPTARAVRLLRFTSSLQPEPLESVAMTPSSGVWSAEGSPQWRGNYYLYEVELFALETNRVEVNRVTDPYSRSLSVNSARSQIVHLDDATLKPPGWDALQKPQLARLEDVVLYELHIRDFSATASDVAPELRGSYLAFTQESGGTRHLRQLAEAGLTHVHLMPAFDIASIEEDRARWKSARDLTGHAPDSEEPQARISAVRDADGYNWGYDPWHFGVPEGSYSTKPDDPARLLQFRQMVAALSSVGLRVVMDVVYNHTFACGQHEKSVLDRIVPGYYHRLDGDGHVATSTCCPNTASENAMMERLMIDDLVHWAVDFKIDGFRFDLMGHHMKRNMVKARDALRALTPERHGVDGTRIVLYGEGWDFGEVRSGARGENATQTRLAGTGIGTFNDRIRDALRGGDPFNDRREQGFLTGRFLDPNGFQGSGDGDRNALLAATDRIRVGLAGNLRDYTFVGRSGASVRGDEADNGGYAAHPLETVNYVSAHDNETLWDKIAWASPPQATLQQRVRMQMLGMAVVAVAQGVPFFHAGIEMLRSKSLDADSFNSGDWFNRLDFTYQSNNFGVGLPPAERNRDRWNQMREVLGRSGLTPGAKEIRATAAYFRTLLRLRAALPLLRLSSPEEIHRRVRFYNTGEGQTPGLIVMGILDQGDGLKDLDPTVDHLLVVINGGPQQVRWRFPGQTPPLKLHPILANCADEETRRASFADNHATVGARTLAVFVGP